MVPLGKRPQAAGVGRIVPTPLREIKDKRAAGANACRTTHRSLPRQSYTTIRGAPMAGRRHMHYGEPQLVNSGDSSGSTVTEQISGAFDAFRDAYAAAQEMRDSGFAENDVRICSSPANPDRTPEGSLAQNAAAALGIVQRLLSSLTGGDGR